MMSGRKILLVLALVSGPVYTSRSPGGEGAFMLQVRQTLDRSASFYRSIATGGGYAGIYSLDLARRYGEALSDPARPMEIWVQPPGTPSVGQAFLRAYKLTGDKGYLTGARSAGRALAWGQCAEGGWAYKADLSLMTPDWEQALRRSGRCTLDDCTTQGALDFLMSLDEVLDEPWLTEAVELGLAYMLKSQFPNGAWPQCYPFRGRYADYYTFNDQVINDCIKVMLKAHQLYKRPEHLRSAEQGGDFIILSQLPEPQAGWAQQYSHDVKPAGARVYEPPAVCSQDTAWNIKTLVDLCVYTQNPKYLAPIPKAIRWLERSRLGPNTWARLYEIGSNRPIYVDSSGRIHYRLEDIQSDRKASSYNWQGPFAVNVCIGYYEKVMRAGIRQYQEAASAPPSAAGRRRKAQSLRPAVEQAVRSLDGGGRWLRNDMIHIADFVKNFNNLCEYLELSGTDAPQRP